MWIAPPRLQRSTWASPPRFRQPRHFFFVDYFEDRFLERRDHRLSTVASASGLAQRAPAAPRPAPQWPARRSVPEQSAPRQRAGRRSAGSTVFGSRDRRLRRSAPSHLEVRGCSNAATASASLAVSAIAGAWATTSSTCPSPRLSNRRTFGAASTCGCGSTASSGAATSAAGTSCANAEVVSGATSATSSNRRGCGFRDRLRSFPRFRETGIGSAIGSIAAASGVSSGVSIGSCTRPAGGEVPLARSRVSAERQRPAFAGESRSRCPRRREPQPRESVVTLLRDSIFNRAELFELRLCVGRQQLRQHAGHRLEIRPVRRDVDRQRSDDDAGPLADVHHERVAIGARTIADRRNRLGPSRFARCYAVLRAAALNSRHSKTFIGRSPQDRYRDHQNRDARRVRSTESRGEVTSIQTAAESR